MAEEPQASAVDSAGFTGEVSGEPVVHEGALPRKVAVDERGAMNESAPASADESIDSIDVASSRRRRRPIVLFARVGLSLAMLYVGAPWLLRMPYWSGCVVVIAVVLVSAAATHMALGEISRAGLARDRHAPARASRIVSHSQILLCSPDLKWADDTNH